jgi:hypothetical protein
LPKSDVSAENDTFIHDSNYVITCAWDNEIHIFISFYILNMISLFWGVYSWGGGGGWKEGRIGSAHLVTMLTPLCSDLEDIRVSYFVVSKQVDSNWTVILIRSYYLPMLDPHQIQCI